MSDTDFERVHRETPSLETANDRFKKSFNT